MGLYVAIFVWLFCSTSGFCDTAVLLTGDALTIEQLVDVARYGAKVKVTDAAKERVRASHDLLLQAAKANMPIYGLNRGVGLNKDKKIFQGDAIDPEVKKLSQEFNKNMIYSHSIGIGPNMPEELIRAALVVRLNTLLKGAAGIQEQAIDLFVEFLNQKIHPLLPCRGSIGEADIGILAHIALAMIGEGKVIVEGKEVSAKEALEEAGIEPLEPYAKDALAILSSNAYSTSFAALTLHDASGLVSHLNLVFAMSLEGLNGNIAPILPQVQKLRPFCSQWKVAKEVRMMLEGSYLWQLDQERALQDPLSFRDATQIHGAVLDYIEVLRKQLEINLNSSDDNPAVIVGIKPDASTTPQELQYYVADGAIMPSANFEPITWVMKAEGLAIAFAHASHASVQRMIVLSDPAFTHLSRFLAPNDKTIAFGTIQKAFLDLDTEIRALCNPVSTDFLPAAGGIEDHATNAALVIRRLSKIVDNLTYITGLEELHAAQALDLRLKKTPMLTLGKDTSKELAAFRQHVPFLSSDRVMHVDIEKAYRYVRGISKEL